MEKVNIIEYLSGLTAYVFDKSVLKRIALDRGVLGIEDCTELDEQTRDLLKADLYYTAYMSPNVWASSTHSHGSFSQTIGSQTIYNEERERLYNMFMRIYTKYNDKMLSEVSASDSNLQWLDC